MLSDFEQYVLGRGAELGRLAYLLTGTVPDAEDLLQTTFAKLLPRWGRVSAVEDVDAYVRRALVNASKSWWGRKRRRFEVLVDHVPEVVAADPGPTDNDLLVQLVAGLPTGQRAVIVLRYYEQRNEAEVAAILGVSEGTVKSQGAKARRKLRAAWLTAESNEMQRKQT
jgi:RNA polymerase sigma-70 factor (sigma-E family)